MIYLLKKCEWKYHRKPSRDVNNGAGGRLLVIKQYRSSQKTTRYSPASIIGIKKRSQFGTPDKDRIGTSIVERFNLTMRMNNRRFTRLTNAHSKSLKHHSAMQAIFIMWYNYSRNHSTTKMTPAMASKLSEKKWTLKELVLGVAK